MGHSAGAHIAALLTLDEHYLNAVGLDRSVIRGMVGISGPYDFVPGDNTRSVFGMKDRAATPDPSIEPIQFADPQAPPMLLLHGAADDTVAPANSTKLAQRLQELGADGRAILYPKVGHRGAALALAWPFRWLAPVLRDATTFFHEHEKTTSR
jgi:dipeptidyl aminopeptidase/acylaminoacyl peptidase